MNWCAIAFKIISPQSSQAKNLLAVFSVHHSKEFNSSMNKNLQEKNCARNACSLVSHFICDQLKVLQKCLTYFMFSSLFQHRHFGSLNKIKLYQMTLETSSLKKILSKKLTTEVSLEWRSKSTIPCEMNQLNHKNNKTLYTKV